MVSKLLNVDNSSLYVKLLELEKDILNKHGDKKTFQEIMKDVNLNPLILEPKVQDFKVDSLSANLLPHYNVFDTEDLDLLTIRDNVVSLFKESYNRTVGEEFYIQAWLVVLRQNEQIGPHYHPLFDNESWYGIYYVNAEDSGTVTDNTIVQGQNGLLWCEKTEGTLHSTLKWTKPDKERITIAYNIFKTDPYRDLPVLEPGIYPEAYKFTI